MTRPALLLLALLFAGCCVWLLVSAMNSAQDACMSVDAMQQRISRLAADSARCAGGSSNQVYGRRADCRQIVDECFERIDKLMADSAAFTYLLEKHWHIPKVEYERTHDNGFIGFRIDGGKFISRYKTDSAGAK